MRRRVGVWVLAVLSLTAGRAAAQSVGATTGSLNGRITDGSGGVLPGVTVTATSPALQGSRTTITNEEGAYRLPGVPPGVYSVHYELGGFGIVIREGINVGVGFTATVNVELKLAALEETVTVSGASPVVDVSSTRTATIFEAKQLESLPNARDFWSIMAQAPAVQLQRIDVGGSSAGTQTGYSAYDTKSDQHRPMVEGIVNTEGTNAAGFYYDYGAFDEVSVGTGTSSAEMPWPGIISQFVSKSGGNTYHGRMYADYENKNIQSTNIDAAQIAAGLKGSASLPATELNRMHSYYDLNGDLGGFLKRDKVWWYGSLRKQDIQSLLPNFPVKPFETGLKNVSAKGTYALNKNNKLIALRHVGAEVSAQPARHVPDLGDRRDSQQRRFHADPAVLGAHLQGRVGQRPQRQDVLRGARRAVRLRLAVPPQQQRAGLPGSQHERRERRQPGRLVDQPPAQPGLRHAEHLQGRLGRLAQLQDRRRSVRRKHGVQTGRRRRRQRAGRRAARAAQRRAVRSAAVPVSRRLARRAADASACTSPTPGAPATS